MRNGKQIDVANEAILCFATTLAAIEQFMIALAKDGAPQPTTRGRAIVGGIWNAAAGLWLDIGMLTKVATAVPQAATKRGTRRSRIRDEVLKKGLLSPSERIVAKRADVAMRIWNRDADWAQLLPSGLVAQLRQLWRRMVDEDKKRWVARDPGGSRT